MALTLVMYVFCATFFLRNRVCIFVLRTRTPQTKKYSQKRNASLKKIDFIQSKLTKEPKIQSASAIRNCFCYNICMYIPLPTIITCHNVNSGTLKLKLN